MCVRLHVCLMTFLAKQQLLLLPTQFLIFVVKLPPSCSIWKKNAKNSINKQTHKNKQQSIKIKQILTLTFHVLVNSRPLETPFSPAPSAARAFPGVPPLAAPAGGASLSRRCCLARTWRDEVSWPRPRTGTPCWGIYGGCKQHTALVSLKLLNLFGEQGLLVRILLTCSRCVSSEFHPRVVDFAQMPSCALVGELQSVPKMKKNELWSMLN